MIDKGERTGDRLVENLIAREMAHGTVAAVTVPAYPHHIIQRGNNRAATFFAENDYRFYLECLGHAKIKCQCRLYAYVLMTNHVHFLVEPAEVGDLGRFMAERGETVCALPQRRHVRSDRHLMGGKI